MLFDEFLHLRRTEPVDGHAQNDQPFVSKLLVKLLQRGPLFGAKVSPGSPKIQHNDFSFKVPQSELLPTRGGQSEVRRRNVAPELHDAQRGHMIRFGSLCTSGHEAEKEHYD